MARSRPRPRPPADPLIERLGVLLPQFMDLINRRSAGQTMRIMSECGLTLPQMVALHALRGAGVLRVHGVQEALQLSASATSALVDKLVEKGFVSRVENPDDRREKRLALTPSGTALLDRLARERASEFTNAISVLDPELRAQLVTMFERVIDQLRQGDPACPPS